MRLMTNFKEKIFTDASRKGDNIIGSVKTRTLLGMMAKMISESINRKCAVLRYMNLI
jgi:hypothetical protein